MKRKSQRMKAFVLAVCMLVSILSGISAKPRTVYAADDYPAKYKNSAKDALIDEWNFYNRECTSFVAWCLNARNGVAFHNHYGGVQWGHAKDWGNAARQCGITVDMNPAKGSVWWSSSGTYGHVAWVSSVDGSNVRLEEYNYGNNGNYHERTVAANHASGYIHIKDIPVGNNPKGCLDNAEGGMNTVHVRGWAFDPDAVSQSIGVHVYVGGPAGVGEGHGWIIANARREDVNNVFGVGIYHGFDATIRTSLSGTQTVYVYAINVGGGTGNPLIGTKTVTISKDDTAPAISDVQVVDMDATGYTVTCRAEDAEGIAKVQFPTWTALNDQDDIAASWQDNPSCSGTQDGTAWRFRVNDKDHNFERGIYHTHIYAYDNNGNVACYGLNNIEFQNTYSHVNTVSCDGHTYYLYNDILTWEEAKEKCEELGGHLVTITSTDEQEAVAELIQRQARRGYWIGGSSANGSTWVSGEEFSFSNWEPGEPNADGGEDCYGIYTDKGTWNDWLGSNRTLGLGFICEWEEKKEEHTHAYTGTWKSDAESHWKECECGEKAESASHTLSWITDKEATYQEPGLKHEECGICGYRQNEGTVIDKLHREEPVNPPKTNISKRKVTGLRTAYVYTGKAIKPSIKVQNVAKSGYSIRYQNNKNIGIATITITGKGNYTGKIKKTFQILPKGTSIKKLKVSKKSMTITWKKQKIQTNGYEIQYSLKKNMKPVSKKTVRNSSDSLKLTKLKSQKRYYVRIRTYKTVKGRRYYSSWSSIKSAKVK